MNLSSNIDFNLKHFFLWWGRELSYWIPEKIKQALSDKSGYVFLSIEDEQLKFARLNHGQRQLIGTLPIDEITAEQFQHLVNQDSFLEKAHYVLRLNSEQAIKKVLYLPAAAKENLQQVIAFEMDRFAPFKAEQVYFALKILAKEHNGQIKVLLLLTSKKVLDNLFLKLNDAKIYPAVVDIEEAANNFSDDLETYNLLPEWQRPVKNKVTRFLLWSFSFMVLALTVLVLVLPLWYEAQAIESIRENLNQLEKDSRFVQLQQLDIDNIVDETQQLINIKNSASPLTKLMNRLTQLIPNDTWLTHFKYKDSKLQIQGQSPSASVLIGVLEESVLFSNARFVSPLTQDKRTGMERFKISMDVNVPEDNVGE